MEVPDGVLSVATPVGCGGGGGAGGGCRMDCLLKWRLEGLVIVPSRRNANGVDGRITSLRTLLASASRARRSPPTKCQGEVEAAQRQGLRLVRSLKPDTEPKQVHDCVEASAWPLRCVDIET